MILNRAGWLLLHWLYDILLYKRVLFNQASVEWAFELFSISYFGNNTEVNTCDFILWHLWVDPENKYLEVGIAKFLSREEVQIDTSFRNVWKCWIILGEQCCLGAGLYTKAATGILGKVLGKSGPFQMLL